MMKRLLLTSAGEGGARHMRHLRHIPRRASCPPEHACIRHVGGILALCVSLCLIAPGEALAQSCADDASLPCQLVDEVLQVQKAPALIRFQARVSQAKLPEGSGQFASVTARFLHQGTTVCQEVLPKPVLIENGVLNLTIGRGVDCALDEIIAAHSGLQLQLCLGSASSCLKPIALSAVPYALKSSYTREAAQAQRATTAGQAHYTHRATADREVFHRQRLGTGYFDFYTPQHGVPSNYGTAAWVNGDYSDGGFIAWTPIRQLGANKLYLLGRSYSDSSPSGESFRWLDKLTANAAQTETRGPLVIYQAYTAAQRATANANNQGLVVTKAGARVKGPVALNGALNVTDNSTLTGPLVANGTVTVTGATLLEGSDATLAVDGNATFKNNLTVEGPTQLSSLSVAKQSTVNDALIVHKASTLTGTLDVDGPVSLDSGLAVKESVALAALNVASGATSLKGSGTLNRTLTVSGSQNTTLEHALTVAKAATLKQGLDVAGTVDLQALTVTGPMQADANLTLQGATTSQSAAVAGLLKGGTLTVGAGSTVQGNVSATTTAGLQGLSVTGKSSLNTLQVAGATTLQAASLSGHLTVGKVVNLKDRDNALLELLEVTTDSTTGAHTLHLNKESDAARVVVRGAVNFPGQVTLPSGSNTMTPAALNLDSLESAFTTATTGIRERADTAATTNDALQVAVAALGVAVDTPTFGLKARVTTAEGLVAQTTTALSHSSTGVQAKVAALQAKAPSNTSYDTLSAAVNQAQSNLSTVVSDQDSVSVAAAPLNSQVTAENSNNTAATDAVTALNNAVNTLVSDKDTRNGAITTLIGNANTLLQEINLALGNDTTPTNSYKLVADATLNRNNADQHKLDAEAKRNRLGLANQTLSSVQNTVAGYAALTSPTNTAITAGSNISTGTGSCTDLKSVMQNKLNTLDTKVTQLTGMLASSQSGTGSGPKKIVTAFVNYADCTDGCRLGHGSSTFNANMSQLVKQPGMPNRTDSWIYPAPRPSQYYCTTAGFYLWGGQTYQASGCPSQSCSSKCDSCSDHHHYLARGGGDSNVGSSNPNGDYWTLYSHAHHPADGTWVSALIVCYHKDDISSNSDGGSSNTAVLP